MIPCRLRPARVLLLAGLCVGLLVPGLAADGRAGRGERARAEQILQRLDRAQAVIRTLRARIVERRELAVLENAEVLRGTLYFARPGRVRWEYDDPERRIYVLDDGELVGLIPGRRRAERLDVSRRQDRIERMLALGQPAEDLRREFRIEAGDHDEALDADELRLVPRSRRVRRRVRELRLWVDRSTGLLDRIRFVTGSGDVVTLDIDRLEINPELPADLFRLEIPEGFEIADGLSTLGPGAGAAREGAGTRR